VQSEPGSIEQLYRQHSGELYSYLARRCPDTATAGDLLQETFLQVVRQTDQLPAVTMPRAWLFGNRPAPAGAPFTAANVIRCPSRKPGTKPRPNPPPKMIASPPCRKPFALSPPNCATRWN